ncbi:TetR/AcrR family transcriptional regulator [Methylomonas sp. AM2-LC]|uniref:TetR/AcrR family transcriptional regulator n=1 Tax=Methylomonas sp. AM2-LC TaxID=3153301 RepID=UPI003263D504
MSRNLHDHILQIASGLFYSHGIKATGIDAIVKASGIAKMSLYKYFPSKDDLVLAYLHKSAEKMQNMLLVGLAARQCTPRQKLLLIFEIFAELIASPEFRGCPFFNATAECADASSPIQQASTAFYESFCTQLTVLAEQAGAQEPAELARQLTLLITGALVSGQLQSNSHAMRSAYNAAEVLINCSVDNNR